MAELIVKVLKIVALVAVVSVIVTYMVSLFVPALSGFGDAVDTFSGYLGAYLYCARTVINWLMTPVVANVMLVSFFVLPFVKVALRWLWRFQNLDQN